MKRHSLSHIVSIILLVNSVCFLSSCNEEGLESFEAKTPASTHTCRMTFDVDFTGFDAQDSTTRASIHGWDEGDVVYLTFFSNTGNNISGKAIYSQSSEDWTVSYNGILSQDIELPVSVYYFDGNEDLSSESIEIKPTVGVYGDRKGTYKYKSSTGVSISASLSPLTSRVRFKGEKGTSITVCGITSYSNYTCSSGDLKQAIDTIPLQVQSDGYTNYIYGTIADIDNDYLTICNSTYIFTAKCNSSMFQIGQSGWLNIPTYSSHDNWSMRSSSKTDCVVLTDKDGDGKNETLIFYYDNLDHTTEGENYRLNIDPNWRNKATDITTVIFDTSFRDAKPTSTNSWFWGCTNLQNIIDIHNLNTTNVTEMAGMFGICSSLNSIDLSGFKTSSVTNMRRMFYDCSSLTSLDLSNFNTSSVYDMSEMFNGCTNLSTIDLSGFDTENCRKMSYLFYGCSSLKKLDISNFETYKLFDINKMLNGCINLKELNVGDNDFSHLNYDSDCFLDVGSLTSPCKLIIGDFFKLTYLGYKIQRMDGEICYLWHGGYFSNPTIIQSDYNYEYVDLGLPSGVCWATTDVGSNSIFTFGYQFAWGETSPKIEYTKDNYMYNGGSPLSSSADAACVNMGMNWRIPTKNEWQELANNCTWDYYYDERCVIGISKINGNTITFCPKDFYADDDSYSEDYSIYWSREEDESSSSGSAIAYYVVLHDYGGRLESSVFITQRMKYFGLLVRAVRNK